ncbi:MAG: STAS domain-containing protein [Bacteroidia bacterium]
MSFSFNITHKTDFILLELHGELLDAFTAKEMLEKVDEVLAEQKEVKSIIIDLHGLNFINSTGLGVLIKVLTKARNNGGEVVISRVEKRVKDLLIITKLNSVFKVLDTLKEAKDYLKPKEA